MFVQNILSIEVYLSKITCETCTLIDKSNVPTNLNGEGNHQNILRENNICEIDNYNEFHYANL